VRRRNVGILPTALQRAGLLESLEGLVQRSVCRQPPVVAEATELGRDQVSVSFRYSAAAELHQRVEDRRLDRDQGAGLASHAGTMCRYLPIVKPRAAPLRSASGPRGCPRLLHRPLQLARSIRELVFGPG